MSHSPTDPLRQMYAQCSAIVPTPTPARPNRHERRRAWALVPRPVRETAVAPALDWLPPRTRALLNRTITRRNALDRTLAVSKGLAPDSPKCARFAGVKYREALDCQVRANAKAGA